MEENLKSWFWVFVWIIVALVQPCFNISPNFPYKTHNTQPTCSSKSKWVRKSAIIEYARWHTRHRSRATGAAEKMKSALASGQDAGTLQTMAFVLCRNLILERMICRKSKNKSMSLDFPQRFLFKPSRTTKRIFKHCLKTWKSRNKASSTMHSKSSERKNKGSFILSKEIIFVIINVSQPQQSVLLYSHRFLVSHPWSLLHSLESQLQSWHFFKVFFCEQDFQFPLGFQPPDQALPQNPPSRHLCHSQENFPGRRVK